MRCTNCKLCQHSLSQVMPNGSLSPEIYFLIDSPDTEDCRFAQSMSGPRGRFMDVFLKSLGVRDYRYFSLTRCCAYNAEYTEDYAEDDKIRPVDSSPVAPPIECIDKCADYFKMDIFKTKPKVIVTLGGLPTQYLLGITDKISSIRGESRKVTIHGEEFIVVPTFSPSYLINNPTNQEIAETFFRDLKKAHEIANGTYVDIMETINLNYALTYSDLKKYIDENLADEPSLSYDIETNAELVYAKDFKIIGYSLSKKHEGVYACLESLDYQMTEEDKKKSLELLVDTLKDKNIIVHNSNYERPATLYQCNYELPKESTDDTLVMAKLLLGGKWGAGLKASAQKIGYPAWDKELDVYIKSVKSMIKRLNLVKFRCIKDDMSEGLGIDMIVDKYSTCENATVYTEILDYCTDMLNIILKYYPDKLSCMKVSSLISKRIIDGMENGIPGTIPYNWIPYRMLCKYGATDAVATFDLKDHFLQRFRDESTSEVDLARGYKYYLAEHYTGFAMIMAALKWDDKSAQRDYEMFESICIKSLKKMISHPVVEQYVLSRVANDYLPDIIYDEYNDYFKQQFDKRVIVHDESKEGNKKYKLETINPKTNRPRKVHIKHLMDDVQLSESLQKDLGERILKSMRNDIQNCDNLGELKKYFNPSSTVPAVAQLANKVLLTDETRFSKLLKELQLVTSQESYDVEKLEGDDKALMENLTTYLSYNAKEHPDDWIELRKPAYENLKKQIASIRRFKNKDLQTAVGEARNFVLDGMGDPIQISIYDVLKMQPINPDDPKSWTDTFDWLVRLRWYKKSMKIMSSYIEGKVGRSSVWVVDKHALENGEDIVPRLRTYQECETDENGVVKIDDENEAFIEQTSFGIGTAETFRWRSAYHTLPAGSSVKKLYTSRYKAGTVLMPDFSANEVRCIASAAQEKPMLDAFSRGADIHKSNAAMIYGVPEEEITHFQRRFAKTATFCFTGDTPVPLPNGTVMTMKELYDNYQGKSFWSYSLNDKGNVVPGLAHSIHVSGQVNKLIKVQLDDGSSYKCTPDHLWLTRDGNYVKAKDLTKDMSLMPFYHNKNDSLVQNSSGEWVTEDNAMCLMSCPHNSAYYIHHKDNNPQNNSPDNIIKNSTEQYKLYSQIYAEDLLNSASVDDNDYGDYPSNPLVLSIIRRLIHDRAFYPPIYDDVAKKLGLPAYSSLSSELGTSVYNMIRQSKSVDMYKGKLDYDNKVLIDVDKHLKDTISDEVLHQSCIRNYDKTDIGQIRPTEIHDCPKITAVIEINLTNPENVYDFTVDGYHNFAIGTESGVFVHNSVLYGASPFSIAENYFEGNLAQANKLLDDFYSAFPAIKAWIDARHEEVMKTHKVSVLTQRFINIDFNPNDKKEASSAMRAAQNYPIQSASSTIAALIFSDIIKYQRDKNMRTKPILFIHDSLESDVYPFELFDVLKFQQRILANGAIDYFGIQCKADVAMGYSLGHECEMEELTYNDEMNEGYITLSGWKDEIEDTYFNWMLAYNLVDVVESDWKKEYIPFDQSWIPRKAFDPTVMTNRYQGSCKIHIRYYDDNGEISPMCTVKPEHDVPTTPEF